MRRGQADETRVSSKAETSQIAQNYYLIIVHVAWYEYEVLCDFPKT